MNVKISDLMVAQAITTTPHKSVGHARKVMREQRISMLPVVGPEGEPVGVVSASDLLDDLPDEKPVSQLLTEKVYVVPAYDDVHVAARVMRNHHIHHLVVTHEGAVAGILSAFDLLKLVEDHRFTMKNAPTPKKRGKQRS